MCFLQGEEINCEVKKKRSRRSKKKRIVESDIPILMSFEALENKQKQTKIDIESFSTKRSLVLMKIENNGKSM